MKKFVNLSFWSNRHLPEPQTTNTNKANNHGPTGYFSSADFCNISRTKMWLILYEMNNFRASINNFLIIKLGV